MMQPEINQLDELAKQSKLDATDDSRARELMKFLCETGYSISKLVDRYGSSDSDYILISLASVVSKRSPEESEPFLDRPVFKLAKILKLSAVPESVLQLCLSAVHRELLSSSSSEVTEIPTSAANLILEGLRRKSRHAWVVYTSALMLLQTMCWRGILQASFARDQLAHLRVRVERLRSFSAANIQPEVESLLMCLAELDSDAGRRL